MNRRLPAKVVALGIDAGGTKTAGGLVALPEGRVLMRRTIPTMAARSGRAVLDDVLRLSRLLADEAAAQGMPAAVAGLGICELVDVEGRPASGGCLKWLDLPVREELCAIAPAWLESDVRAAALAEALFGEGKRFRNFLYVTIGTGISCCLMIDGTPWSGSRGFAGTMASSPLSIPCGQCGHNGTSTLEELAAGPALVRRFREAGGTAASGHEVLAAAAANDARARRILRDATESLGSQLGLLVSTLDPEAVIIGGGVGLSGGMYWDDAIASTRRHVWSPAARGLRILRAATGADAGWIGAAAAAWRALGLSKQ